MYEDTPTSYLTEFYEHTVSLTMFWEDIKMDKQTSFMRELQASRLYVTKLCFPISTSNSIVELMMQKANPVYWQLLQFRSSTTPGTPTTESKTIKLPELAVPALISYRIYSSPPLPLQAATVEDKKKETHKPSDSWSFKGIFYPLSKSYQ